METSQQEKIEKKEFNFSRGVEHLIRMSRELLRDQQYVIIGVAGPIGNDVNVGKSYLYTKLSLILENNHIPEQKLSGIDSIDERYLGKLKAAQKEFKHNGGVLIVDSITILDGLDKQKQMNFRNMIDRELKETAEISGLNISKVDIYTLIYRPPDKLFKPGQENFADVIIRNTHARNK